MRTKRALGSGENYRCTELIDSEMAGPIRLKLGGIVEGITENDLAKVGGPLVPLLGHGDEVESPNWVYRDCRT